MGVRTMFFTSRHHCSAAQLQLSAQGLEVQEGEKKTSYPKDPRDWAEDGAGKNSDPTLSGLIPTPSHRPCSPRYTHVSMHQRGRETELLTFRRKRGNDPIGSLLSRGEQGKYGGKWGKETEAGTSNRTMKAGLAYCSLLVLLLITDVCGQRRPKPKPARPTRKPPAPKKPSPPTPKSEPEPQEPTDFPPPILGPPSEFPDCPRECFCPPSYPNALYCENRNLRKVPIIPFRTHYLYLQNNYINQVTAESFKNCTELKWINLGNNRIRSVEKQMFDKLPNLLYLYMERNELKEVPDDLPNGLEQLRLSRNQITKIPPGAFSKMENLALLDLHNNRISDSSLGKNIFKDLKNLIQLNLAHNILRKMPPNIPKSLFQLFLDKNNIEEIPQDYFKDFTNLAFVRLNYNLLSDKGVPKLVFNVSSLLDLHLSHNQLSTIPLFSSELEQLHLNNNNIESLNGTEICPSNSLEVHDENGAPKLRYLRLDGNHLIPPVPSDVIMCFRHLHAIVI
ncbi:hypothetical protein QQF64_003711 [Cirrhinus molitorella]|uniref:LRRNT domain-containing protein n=1 Tax=Cirrhinus molitorella TaxID=172907 RepID=A0ABR3MM35_9TELE